MKVAARRRPTQAAARADIADGRYIRGSATRERILLVAERLFADSGISNVSLRDVGAAADQRNNGAVQYHFGDRENLVREIVRFRTAGIIEVRAQLLAQVVSGNTPHRPHDYIDAFVMSLASCLTEGNHYLRFLSRFYADRGDLSTFHVLPDDTITLTKHIMRNMLTHLTDELIEERWKIITIATVHTLAGYQSAMLKGTLSAPIGNLLAHLIEFMTAGLEAPAPKDTPRK